MIRSEHKIFLAAVAAGLSFWIVDALLDAFVFRMGRFRDLLLLAVPPHELYVRLLVMGLFAAVGATVAALGARYRHAERAWRDAAAHYHAIVDSFDGYVYVCGADRRIEFMNRKMRDRIGRDAIGETCHAALYDLPSTCPWCEDQRLASGQTARWDVLNPRDGCWYDMVLTPLRHQDGSLSKMAVIRDITPQKKALLELEESRRSMSDLMGNLPGMAYRCRNDRDWTMEFVSEGCRDLTGFAADELVGNRLVSYAGLIHPDDRERVWSEVQGALAARERFRMTYRLIARDGGERVVWEQGTGIRDAAGELLALEGFITDITKLRRAERSVWQHAQRLEILRDIDAGVLAARSPAAIAQAAVERIPQLLPSHRASVALFDTAAGEAHVLAAHTDGTTEVGTGARVPLEAAFGDLERLRQGLPHVVVDVDRLPDLASQLNLHRLRAEGLRAYLTMPLVAQGELLGTLNIGARDPGAFGEAEIDIAREVATSLGIAIQQARLNERILRQAAELEQRVAERTADLEFFTQAVSHDLRAPLRALGGFAQALAEECDGHLESEPRRLLAAIRDQAAEMGQLIERVLAFSRIGRVSLAARPLDMAALVAEARARLTVALQPNGLSWREGELPWAWGDPTLLRQVWDNLLTNAVKFAGGRAGAEIEIGAMRRGETVAYFVRDNGAGFDPAQAGRLFQPFSRLAEAAEIEGSGLGLAIVRRIVERHGGCVWAEGRRGGGATFWFELPAAQGVRHA